MVILYTTGCPKCKVLEKKLDNAKVSYTKIDDMDEILKVANEAGFDTAPMLDINGTVVNFEKAVEWVNSL